MSSSAIITKFDFDKICRTCLEFKDGMVSILTTDMLNMLQIFTTIKINENDQLPNQICTDCVNKTYETMKFKKLCENSEQFLIEILNENDDKKWFENSEENNTKVKTNEIEKIVKIETEIPEIKDEKDEDDNFSDNNGFDDDDDDRDNSVSSEDDEFKITNDIEIRKNNLSLRKSRINWVMSLGLEKCDTNLLLCKICSKTLVNISSLARHMETHDKNRKICATCNICNKGFYENGNYVRHMQRHKRDAKYKCEHCSKSFYELNILSKHLQKQHNVKSIKCTECDKEFIIKSQLEMHLKKHKNEYDHVCKYCGKGYLFIKKLEKHLLTHEKTYFCEICNKTYKNQSTLRKHNFHCHKNVQERQVCQICGKTVLHMKRHLLYAHSEDNVKCPDCSKEFPSTYGLNIHIWKLHKNSAGPRKKPYLCSTCGYTCECRAALKIHYERKHATERAYKCSICEKCFKTRTEHLRHVRFTHNSDSRPTLKCQICDKAFKRRSALAYHNRYSHSNERRFNCTGCSKQFKTSGTLKIHMRIHTGERPYECKYCGKAFGQGSTLKTHMKVHASTLSVAASTISEPQQQQTVDSTTTFLLNNS